MALDDEENASVLQTRRPGSFLGRLEPMIGCDTDHQNGNDNRTGIEPRPRQTGENNHGEEADPWNGPFTEYNKYDRPTGHAYVRCVDCGIEVVTSQREHATHRAGCGHADGGER